MANYSKDTLITAALIADGTTTGSCGRISDPILTKDPIV